MVYPWIIHGISMVVKDVCHGLQEEAHSCKEEPPAGQGDMERIQGEGAASPIASPIGFPQDNIQDCLTILLGLP